MVIVHYKLLQRILQNFNAGGLFSGWSFVRGWHFQSVVFCPVVFCPYTGHSQSVTQATGFQFKKVKLIKVHYWYFNRSLPIISADRASW